MDEAPSGRCEFDTRSLVVKADLEIAGTVRAIEPAVEAILRIVAEMGCAAGKEFQIETALREALANAVVHGCRNDPQKAVKISVGCDTSRGMIIVVRDPGEGFDPSQIPSPVEGQRIWSEHGRGIYLINQVMDEVRYREAGTEIWMRKG